jgi:hypothetical protein
VPLNLSSEVKNMPRDRRNISEKFWHARPTVGVYTMGVSSAMLLISV